MVGGVVYGVTPEGGNASCTNGCGLVFSLTATSNPNIWRRSVIHAFRGGRDGFMPMGKLTAGLDGSLYGVTSKGGASTNCGSDGCGTVYKLTPGASWTKTVLYHFAVKDPADGQNPQAGLEMDGSGALYGNTYAGGSNFNGTIFMLSPPVAPKTAWTETRLFDFVYNTTGGSPDAPLTRVASGRLYGVTPTGGAHFDGTVFELVPPVS